MTQITGANGRGGGEDGMGGWIAPVGLAGFLIAAYGLVSAVLVAGVTWYSYFTIGGTLALGALNQRLGNRSILWRARLDRRGLVARYSLYLIATLLIEVVGRYLLGWWEYPAFGTADLILHVFVIGYPFGLFLVCESYLLLRRALSLPAALVAATLGNAFLAEVPNTFAWEWRYRIPYVTVEILRVNIVVIAGWVILVLIAVLVEGVVGQGAETARRGSPYRRSWLRWRR